MKRIMQSGIVGLGLSIVLTASAAIAQPATPAEREAERAANNRPFFDLEDLGVLPGADESVAEAVDNRGNTVGYSGNQSFVHTKSGMKPFPATNATRVSNVCEGQFVGITFPGRPVTKGGPVGGGDGAGVPFYYTSSGGMELFPLPGFAGEARDVSRFGVRVGTVSQTSTCSDQYLRQRAFAWNKDDSVVLLPSGKSEHSSAIATNDNGTIFAGHLFGSSYGSELVSVIWFKGLNGKYVMRRLGNLGGTWTHVSVVINNGFSFGSASGTDGKVHAFKAYPQGNLVDITPKNTQGYTDFYVTGANNKEAVVGFADMMVFTPQTEQVQPVPAPRGLGRRGGPPPVRDGWILYKGKFHFLKDLIPSSAGWTQIMPYVINDDFETVGSGLHNGKLRAFKARLIPGTLQ